MLFQEIAKFIAKSAEGAKIILEIQAAKDGKLEVAVTPIADPGKAGVNPLGQTFTETPEALDAQFSQVIAGFVVVNLTLMEQLAVLQKQASEAQATASAEAKAAQAARPKPRSVVPATKPGPTLLPHGGESGHDNEDEDDLGVPTPSADPSPMPVSFTL